MRNEIGATVVVMVLAIVGVVALWPRDATPAARAASPQQVGELAPTAPVPDDVELAELRGKANLRPCPGATAPAPGPAGPLAGIAVPCLGAPGQVDLGAALAGRPALLNIWASWCQPCREEIPVLAAYAAQPGAVPVIGLNVRDQPADALALLARLGVDLPSVTDPDGRLQGALRAPPVLPTSFVLRPDGSVDRVNPPRVLRTPDEVTRAVADGLAGVPR